MGRHLSKSLWLLFFSVVIVCVIYPGILWAVGQSFWPFQVNGSIVRSDDGKAIGSLLIAQPFTKDEYFQPRPSSNSYDGTSGSSSALAASNYALRDRVARTIAPLATYADGAKKGQPVAPDVDTWFQADKAGGNPHIVAQWADAHNSVAQAWVTGDPTHSAYVDDWAKSHQAVVQDWIKKNPATAQPKAADLAVVFFETYSTEHPGTFPSAVTKTDAAGKPATTIEPVKEGADIETMFFDTWRSDHPDVAMDNLPADLVTASASGLDPDITYENAEFQLDRVASKWAADKKLDAKQVHHEVQQILDDKAVAPWGGALGEKMINVLEVNIELHKKYGDPA